MKGIISQVLLLLWVPFCCSTALNAYLSHHPLGVLLHDSFNEARMELEFVISAGVCETVLHNWEVSGIDM